MILPSQCFTTECNEVYIIYALSASKFMKHFPCHRVTSPYAYVFTIKSSDHSTIHAVYDTSVPVQQRHLSVHVMLKDTPVMSHKHFQKVYLGLI